MWPGNLICATDAYISGQGHKGTNESAVVLDFRRVGDENTTISHRIGR
jgi:hypothetical protein